MTRVLVLCEALLESAYDVRAALRGVTFRAPNVIS
jgi:hypothetical protein